MYHHHHRQLEPKPEGCLVKILVNDGLPTELLAHIFYLGTRDSDTPGPLPFPVLASHVCRLWRNVALDSPSLWTTIAFSRRPPYEHFQFWIERSKNLPIEIKMDLWFPDREAVAGSPLTSHVSTILDIIVPHVTRWRKLVVFVDRHVYMDNILTRLAQCASAPLLEVLALQHRNPGNPEWLTLEWPLIPFHGNAPRLSRVTFVEVSIDWSSSLLHDLVEFNLIGHRMDVRPTWVDFSRILRESPCLTHLELYMSGPAKPFMDWQDDPIELPSLENLSLTNRDPIYLSSLFQLLSMPNLKKLTIDLMQDSLEVIRQLATPPRSVLSSLQYLIIHHLFGDSGTINAMYKRLPNLEAIYLDCTRIDKFFTTLMEPFSGALHCPNLTTIITSGISAEKMRLFIAARAIAEIPIKRIVMAKADDLNNEDERWLRENVQSFERFSDPDEIDTHMCSAWTLE